MYSINEKRLIKTFIDMAKISSPSWKESEVIEYIVKEFGKIGVKIEKHKCESSYNLIARIPATDKSKGGVILSAHTDTVTPCENIKVIETDTIIKTDGNSILGGDDKAGIAAIIESVRYVLENNIPHGEIEILLTCAEEVGLCGAKGLDTKLLKAKHAFIFDSDGAIGKATIQAPYQVRGKIEIKGKASHAGMSPEKGVSAIFIAADMITKFPKGRIDEETTANVGKIGGGSADNIVAESAWLTYEARSLDLKKLKKVDAEIKKIAKDSAKAFKGKTDVTSTLEYSGYRVKESDPIMELFSKACRNIKIKPKYETSCGGSDTNILNNKGIKSLTISIGMTNAHTTSECISKKDLILGTKLAVSLIESA